jgi:branched-chain amino acid transport system substrate-binding protein
MKSKKIVSLAVAGAVLAGAAMPFSVQAQDPEVIRIYSSLPLTGSSAGQTTTIVNSMKLAIDQKTKGGLVCNGKFKIDYVSLDDATAAKGAWDGPKEQENANKAVADVDAMVYLGTYNSGAAKVSIPILNQAGLVMVSPANTYEGLTKKTVTTAEGDPDKYYPTGKRNYARVVVSDDVQGQVAAKWAKSLGAKKVFILHDTEAYGKGVADVFRFVAKEIKLEEVGYEGIDGKAADYNALATKIKSTGADFVYYGGITQNNAGQLIKDIRKAGITAKFMGPDGIKELAFLSAAGEAANGTYVTGAGVPENLLPAAGRKFYADYRKLSGGKEPEQYTIFGYEAMSVALNAISKVCVKDRAAILDAVMTTKNFRGVLGNWSFDKNGDINLAGITGVQVAKGKFTPAKVLKFP